MELVHVPTRRHCRFALSKLKTHDDDDDDVDEVVPCRRT